MNRLFHLLLVFLLGALNLYFAWPWFLLALAALVSGFFWRVSHRAGFWYAFLAGLFLWGGYLTYVQFTNDGLLADRMAALFQLPNGWWMVAITALWGGITAGLGGWWGVALSKVLGRGGKVGGKPKK